MKTNGQYIHKLKNGKAATLKMEIEVEKMDKGEIGDLLNFIARSSRTFYLKTGNEFNDTHHESEIFRQLQDKEGGK